jgi:ubiquitin carboxyl-terminal hydrolase 10
MSNIKQHDSVRTVEDALARISHPQPVHLDSSGNEAHQQMLIEVLPPVLVIHIKRSLYDPAVGGMVKIGKPIQFTPYLEIPPGTTSPFVSHQK